MVVPRRRAFLGALLLTFALLGAAEAVAEPARTTQPAGTVPVLVAPTFDQLLDRQGALVQRMKPDARKLLAAAGREVFVRGEPRPAPGAKPKTVLDTARDVVGSPVYAGLGTLATGDIEALVFLVLMQAAKSAQEDLKAIMDQVKEIDHTKSGYRAMVAEIAKLRDKRADAGSGLADLSQEQQLKMQMVMDRMAKIEEVLANLLRKVADAQSSIVSNMK